MDFVDALAGYNQHIGIDAPRLHGLDVRSFGENMPHVRREQPPFGRAIWGWMRSEEALERRRTRGR